MTEKNRLMAVLSDTLETQPILYLLPHLDSEIAENLTLDKCPSCGKTVKQDPISNSSFKCNSCHLHCRSLSYMQLHTGQEREKLASQIIASASGLSSSSPRKEEDILWRKRSLRSAHTGRRSALMANTSLEHKSPKNEVLFDITTDLEKNKKLKEEIKLVDLKMAPGSICTVVSNPGNGKTSFLVEVCLSEMKERDILFFSFELTRRELTERLMGLRHNNLTAEDFNELFGDSGLSHFILH